MATRSLAPLLSQRGLLTFRAHIAVPPVAPSAASQWHIRGAHSLTSGHSHGGHSLHSGHSHGSHSLTSGHRPAVSWTLPGVMKRGSHLEGTVRASCPLSWCVVRGYAKKAKKDKAVKGKGGKKKVTLSAEELDGVLDLGKLHEEMTAVTEELKQQMVQQVSIRTNISAYDSLAVKTEDGVFPLVQLGQVVQKNPSLIMVNMASSPQYMKAVMEALTQSGFNVNPQQDGTTIFIPVPKITREHREGLARSAKGIHDKAKTRLRDIHNKHVKKVKAAKDRHSEDIIRAAQDLVLDEMHSYGHQLDSMLAAKQEELLGGK